MRSPIGISPGLLPRFIEAPQPPSCPDVGFPSYPRNDRPNRCIEPWIATYDVPCTPEMIECLLFRKRHFAWRQSRLLALLNRRPAVNASAQAKFNWSEETLRVIVDLQDDTNLQHQFLSGHDHPDFFDRTRAALSRMQPRDRAGQALPLMFPELWITGAGDEGVPPFHSALGYHVLWHFPNVELVRAAYLRMPRGHTGRFLLEHVRASHEARKPRPIPKVWPARSGAGSSATRGRITRVRSAGRGVQARELSLALFEAAPGPGQFLAGDVERATGSAPCLAGPASRLCFHYELVPVAIAGAEWTMDLLAAHAEDWLHAPYAAVLNAGLQRYLTYLQPWADSGILALTPEELVAHVEESARRESQAWTGTVLGIAATAASLAGPIGAVAGTIIAVIGLVVQLLLEFLPLATGDGGCPTLGFRRTIDRPDCELPNPQGNPGIAALILRFNARVINRRPDAPDVDDEGPSEEPDKSSNLLPVLGVGAALAAALLLGLAAAKKKRKRRARALTEDAAESTVDVDPDSTPEPDLDPDREEQTS